MEDKKISDVVALCVDHGSHIAFAQRLSREYGRVLYFNPIAKSSYPTENDAAVGEGLEGIEVVYDFFDHLDEADVIIFFDLYHDDLQEHLIRMGKRVWGARKGEEIETERIEAKKFMRKLALPVNKYEVVIGLDALLEYLQENEGVFVKLSRWRGDGETFYSENYKAIKSKLDKMQTYFGALAPMKEFCCEKPIDAVCEVGLDICCIDGEYWDVVPWGFEVKDAGFCATIKDYSEVTPLLTELTDRFKPKLKELQYRSWFSTEHRITAKKVSYCIDIVAGRAPSPPSELLQELIENWGEIIYKGAAGIMVQPEYAAKFGMQVVIHCPDACKDWVTIEVPEEIRRWTKLKNVCYYDDAFQYIPQAFEMEEIGSVVAIGNSLEECEEKLKEYCEMVVGHGLEMNVAGIVEKLNKQLEGARSIGIEF